MSALRWGAALFVDVVEEKVLESLGGCIVIRFLSMNSIAWRRVRTYRMRRALIMRCGFRADHSSIRFVDSPSKWRLHIGLERVSGLGSWLRPTAKLRRKASAGAVLSLLLSFVGHKEYIQRRLILAMRQLCGRYDIWLGRAFVLLLRYFLTVHPRLQG